MKLYLVQHGLYDKNDKSEDPGLCDQGVAQLERIAGVAAGYGVNVQKIIHSPKRRARETAEILSYHLMPKHEIHEHPGLKAMDNPYELAEKLLHEKGWEGVMIVTHMPFVSKLASVLVTGSSMLKIFEFQNGGIVCLQRNPEDKRFTISWTLMPLIK